MPNCDFVLQAGQYKLALENYQKICDVLEECIGDSFLTEEEDDKIDTLTLAAFLNQALCFLKLNQNQEAKDACDSALDCDPENVKAHFRRGQVYWESCRMAK